MLLMHKLGQNDKAIQDYSEAIRLDSQYAEAYNYRGVMYHSLSQHDKADVDLNRACELDSDFWICD